ncbi:hypothetical protein HN832_01795 [archaeon]|jgi:RNase P subunit RPR2|nr:hypothetical protein [archaeon]MBT4373088.1 hypothetical protein [archaeon]MBT4531433.1 hypothetical protein [archaeon]MBT7001389.1 hypothetical protein [archaeon]MBT7282125.1 hypothetical protein [archaeon]
MQKKIPKSDAKKEIEKFFLDIKSKSPKEIKQIKRLAMQFKIPLKEKRKLFCKKCYSPNLKVLGIKKGFKKIICKDCENESKWKI